MNKFTIVTSIKKFKYEELTASDQELIDQAKEATATSYSPYSQFSVGAALRLNNNQIIAGSNQENAAFPSGLCAERTAFFYASAKFPDEPIQTLAVAARNKQGFLKDPIPPCGACRQALLEAEGRYKQAIRTLLYGEEWIYEVESISSLLPLSFQSSSMD